MATGLDIGFSSEIGQTTYTELIVVGQRTRLALPGSTPDVDASLRRVAFGQGVRTIPHAPAPTQVPHADEIILRTPVGRQLVATEIEQENDCQLSQVRLLLRWVGTPRRPVNIFNIFAIYTIRDREDQFERSTVKYLATADKHTSTVDCSVWKQQGEGGRIVQKVTSYGLVPLLSYEAGDIADISDRINWVWAIPNVGVPASEQYREFSLHNIPAPPSAIVESVKFMLLMNVVGDNDPATSGCSPDPAETLVVSLRYTNGAGRAREFLLQATQDEFYSDTGDITGWDTATLTGSGVQGTTARWESFEYVLDTGAGDGLDQCSTELDLEFTGEGTLVLPEVHLRGSGQVKPPCTVQSSVVISNHGFAVDEVQTITLPSSISGTWDLRLFTSLATDTATLDFDATAAEVEAALETFTNIGEGNATVTGTGTSLNPFRVELIGTMAGTSVPFFEVDTTDLVSEGEGFVATITDGTLDERQTITLNISPTAAGNMFLSFAGSSVVATYADPSLNQLQAALDAISTLGAGNSLVTGPVADRNIRYPGPWYVDFTGIYASQNVPLLVVDGGPASNPNPAAYGVAAAWEGVTGVNEQQRLSIVATAGTFKLTVFNEDSSSSATTAQISFDATAAAVRLAIIAAASSFYGSGDIGVTKSSSPPDGVTSEYTITYQGDLANIDMPAATVDTNTLTQTGAEADVERLVLGSGEDTEQVFTLVDARFGTYALTLSLRDVDLTTTTIKATAAAAVVQAALAALDNIGDDEIAVTRLDFGVLRLTFAKHLGDVSAVTVDANALQCHVASEASMPSPPYEYELLDDVEDTSEEESVTSADTSAVTGTQFTFLRDLYDPNSVFGGQRATVRHLARNKHVDPAAHTPYLRRNGVLSAIAYSRTIGLGESYVLIRSDLDSVSTRAAILRYLAAHREIIPMRVVY